MHLSLLEIRVTTPIPAGNSLPISMSIWYQTETAAHNCPFEAPPWNFESLGRCRMLDSELEEMAEQVHGRTMLLRDKTSKLWRRLQSSLWKAPWAHYHDRRHSVLTRLQVQEHELVEARKGREVWHDRSVSSISKSMTADEMFFFFFSKAMMFPGACSAVETGYWSSKLGQVKLWSPRHSHDFLSRQTIYFKFYMSPESSASDLHIKTGIQKKCPLSTHPSIATEPSTDVAETFPSSIVISGGTGGNAICAAFGDECHYVLPVSDDGGSSSEIIRVLGGPSIGTWPTTPFSPQETYSDWW